MYLNPNPILRYVIRYVIRSTDPYNVPYELKFVMSSTDHEKDPKDP